MSHGFGGRGRGFTLIELIIMVTIISILATVAVPRMAGIIQKANERASLASLGALKSAVNIYYTEQQGLFPSDLTPFQQPGNPYLQGTIHVFTRFHGNSTGVGYSPIIDGTIDTGQVGFVNVGADWGFVWVQCTHTDSSGKMWSTY